jgi:hypothetical protein
MALCPPRTNLYQPGCSTVAVHSRKPDLFREYVPGYQSPYFSEPSGTVLHWCATGVRASPSPVRRPRWRRTRGRGVARRPLSGSFRTISTLSAPPEGFARRRRFARELRTIENAHRAIERAARIAAVVSSGASNGTRCPTPGTSWKSRFGKVCSIPSAQDGGLIGSSYPHLTTVGISIASLGVCAA